MKRKKPAPQIRMIEFIRPFKKEIFLKVLLGLGIMACSVLRAFAMGRGAAAVLRKESIEVIAVFIAAALAAILLKGRLIYLNETYTKKLGCTVKAGIRSRLLEKLFRLGPKYRTDERSGRLQSLITDGVEALESYLASYLPQVFVALITVTALVTYILYVDWVVGLIIFCCVVVAVIGPHFSGIFFQRSTTEYWKAYAVLNAQYIDTMQGMDTLKAFNSGRKKGAELAGNCWDFYRKQLKTTANSLIDSAFVTLCMGIGTAFSVGLAAYHAAQGKVEVVVLLSMLFLIPECFRPITELNAFWHSSYLGFSVVEQLFEILDEPIVIVEKEQAKTTGLEQALPTIEIRDVNFRYKRGREDVLKHVDMEIRPGQQIAVAGKSGSGKSTLVNILLRFYDPDSGVVLYNGADIRDYALDDLRRKIAVVFQETYLFYGTIRENIALADPQASFARIVEAAKAANIHDFILAQPEGYDTLVGERGANLSGGERQRIAIARAVLKDAPFLILDEATASVDAENEKSIQGALDQLMQNKTSLVIAHRLSTIKQADRIYVLDEGVVCEAGTHEELLAENRIYAKLIEAQNLSRNV